MCLGEGDQSAAPLDNAKVLISTPPLSDAFPEHWEAQNENCELKTVHRKTEEWNKIETLMKKDPEFDINIISIERIQNIGLWKEYKHLLDKNGGCTNERQLFQGTRHIPPAEIYQSKVGFGNSTQEDLGPRDGVFFAVWAKHADKYAHVTAMQQRQVFLAIVLPGNSFIAPREEPMPLQSTDAPLTQHPVVSQADS